MKSAKKKLKRESQAERMKRNDRDKNQYEKQRRNFVKVLRMEKRKYMADKLKIKTGVRKG